ncbi:MAG: hypothetical protein KJ600_04915 [Nanoarchaeota archaeon]|nr:hypothetical protein [Nanoarchaeota archaeon]
MKKRGQVALFVILAILLVALILILFLARDQISNSFSSDTRRIGSVSQQVVHIRDYTYSCAETVSKEAIQLIGLQGGVISSEYAYPTETSLISYGYYKGKERLPSLNIIEKEIDLYIETFLPYCFSEDEFSDFEIKRDKVDSETTIKEDLVVIDIRYPMVASKTDVTFDLNVLYPVDVDVNLHGTHKTADEIVKKISRNPNFIELSFLTDLEYDVTILQKTDEVYVYSVTDQQGFEREEPYTFMFAVIL